MGNTPIYTYQLETGITDDRHGMIIIKNAGILDLLKIRKTKSLPIMSFIADKQTLDDLNLLREYRSLIRFSACLTRSVLPGAKSCWIKCFITPWIMPVRSIGVAASLSILKRKD